MKNSRYIRLTKAVAIIPCLLIGLFTAHAQFRPVQVTTQLVPPYSVYLTDYATPGNDKLRLVILQRDLSKPSYQIRLQFSLELNGTIILRTSPSFSPAPIHLDPGTPTIVTGIDLQPYLDSRNLDFIGISRDEYERTKTLPEGNYQICFTVYDYKRQDIAVSEPGCSFFFLAKDEPPLINFPACGTALPIKNPQQIIFSWLPRNTSSPNSANETDYEFSLYETRPAGRNPNDVVLASNPIFRTNTTATQLVYGMAEPLLFENMVYVWRVRAIDKTGRDQFRNNGYSEACTFINGGTTSDIQLEAIKNLQAVGEAPKKGKATWTAQRQVDGYKLFYKKKGSSYQWFSQETKEASVPLFDLDGDTEYEVRAQSYAGAVFGPYSDIVKFKTPKSKPPICGDPVPPVNAAAKPLTAAIKGMTIDVQGIEMTLNEVQNVGQGLYSGKGEVSIPYFGGATFHVAFKNLFIDETRAASKGRVDFVTKKMGDWIEEEVQAQKRRKQEENREEWKGTDFYEKEVSYDFPITGVTADADGNLIITGADGKTYINKDIPVILINAPDKAIIIEDKNGDQWVVQKDKATGETKITKVPDGGLSPTMDVVVSEEALDYITKALTELSVKYNPDKMKELEKDVETKRGLLDDYIAEENNVSDSEVGDNGANTLIAETWTTPVPITEVTATEDADLGIGTDDKLASLSKLYYELDRQYKTGRVVSSLAQPDNIMPAGKMIAPELKIDNKTVTEFIEQQKAQHMPEKDMLLQVALGIENLLDKLFKDMSMSNIKFEVKRTSP
jgi:TANFOR domain-containing protein